MAFVLGQIEDAGTIEHRKMFGEYALYCDGKVVALVCDNQVFVKPTEPGRALLGELGDVAMAPPYPGAKLYFRIEAAIDDAEAFSALLRATAKALPPPKPKRPAKPSPRPSPKAGGRKKALKK